MLCIPHEKKHSCPFHLTSVNLNKYKHSVNWWGIVGVSKGLYWLFLESSLSICIFFFPFLVSSFIWLGLASQNSAFGSLSLLVAWKEEYTSISSSRVSSISWHWPSLRCVYFYLSVFHNVTFSRFGINNNAMFSKTWLDLIVVPLRILNMP